LKSVGKSRRASRSRQKRSRCLTRVPPRPSPRSFTRMSTISPS
jgi:hypothetical protein